MFLSIHSHPSRAAVASLLETLALPTADLTDAHMAGFFFCGPPEAPTGIIGVEFCGQDALLRSLAVVANHRVAGLGSALVAQAERYARAEGARSVYLLTTTAEAFFRRRGYVSAERGAAPLEIRKTREFSDLCPASSAFLMKALTS